MAGTPCEAHKLKMFASAEGNVITGYVYYTTGGKPKNATVFVQDTDGNTLQEITTDEKGEFTFIAEVRRDYVFVLELPDGHRTTFTVRADELPGALPLVSAEQTVLENQQTSEEEGKASGETMLNQEAMGRLSYQAMARPQLVQRLPG